MLTLPLLTNITVDHFTKEIQPKIINSLVGSSIKGNLATYLSPVKVTEILKAEPKELYDLHLEFISNLGSGCNIIDYNQYFELKGKKKLTKNEKKIVNKYAKIVTPLYKVFDYNKFISANKPLSYKLAIALNRNTCTYCNRLYTVTVENKDSKTGKFNNKNRITRPQFDHWFSKKQHPILALSIYNLIPSCSVCNSSIKGDDEYNLATHVHPYLFDKSETFKFSYSKGTVGINQIEIMTSNTKVQNTLNDLKIQEIYSAHAEYELQDLIDLKYKYSKNYLEVLFKDTFNIKDVSNQEIYRMLFGVEINTDDYHKRAFSKFRHDIIEELLKIP